MNIRRIMITFFTLVLLVYGRDDAAPFTLILLVLSSAFVALLFNRETKP